MPCRIRPWRLALALGVLAIALPAVAEVRIWTDSTGKHTIEAELISATRANVTLRRGDGQEITLPLARLSPADRQFVKEQLAAETHTDDDKPARRPPGTKDSAAKDSAGKDAVSKELRDIADRFYRDLRSKTREDARSWSTDTAQKMAAKPNAPLLKIASPDDGVLDRIGRVKLESSQAEGPVQVRSQGARHETALHLREEDGAWRVFAISATLGGDELTIDFEAEPGPDKPAQGPDPLQALVGQPFQLQGVTLDGTAIDMSQLKGKVVLIDFWATWCRPCRAEMPNILANYQQYHSSGFEVIAVSIDKDLRDLQQFVVAENPPWIVLADRHPRNRTSMASLYGIRSIPAFILVGQDGRVAAVQCRGKRLGQELAKLLDK